MRAVWKYQLRAVDKQDLLLPAGSTLLSATEQYGEIVVYAIVDPLVGTAEMHTVLVVGTGHEWPDELAEARFLGTVKLSDGALMFHVFEQVGERA